MDNSTSTDPIDDFLAQADMRLRANLPVKHRENILAEALEHMEAREAELVASGMEQVQAASTAVADFGDPKTWGRDIVDAAYADGLTTQARQCALCSAAVGLVVGPLLPCLIPSTESWSYCLVLPGLAGLCIGSFRARQFFTRDLICIGFVLALAGFVAWGFTRFDSPGVGSNLSRESCGTIASLYDQSAARGQAEVDLLRLGQHTFGSNAIPRKVPEALRTPNGFIVPLTTSEAWVIGRPAYWFSAFKANSGKTLSGAISTLNCATYYNATPYHTVATLVAAQLKWRQNSDYWILPLKDQVVSNRHEAGALRKAALHPTRFSLKYALQIVQVALFGTILAIALHLTAAAFGRVVFRLRKRNWTQAA